MDELDRVRAICMAFPKATERPSHGAPTFFVGDKRSFLMFHNDHHGDGRLAIWCAAPVGAQQMYVADNPECFFVPPYVGYRGWVGVRLDRNLDWDEVEEVIGEAYRTIASPAIRK